MASGDIDRFANRMTWVSMVDKIAGIDQSTVAETETVDCKSTKLADCIKGLDVGDSILKNVLEAYPAWIDQMTENMREIIETQMDYFDYYSHETVNEFLKILHGMIQNIEDISFDNTVYTVLSSQSGRINSGNYYLIEYKEINKISKHVVFPSFWKLIDKLSYVNNVVLVDDFCGSGNTLIDFLGENLEHLKNKKIYYLIIHAMSTALDEIEVFSKQNSISITVLYCNCTDKAFLRSYTLRSRKEEYIEEAKKIGISNAYILGFKHTEALIAFYNNTPNNTLGIYWNKAKGFTPLFSRNDDRRPSWYQMKSDKKKRTENNYVNNMRNQDG